MRERDIRQTARRQYNRYVISLHHLARRYAWCTDYNCYPISRTQKRVCTEAPGTKNDLPAWLQVIRNQANLTDGDTVWNGTASDKKGHKRFNCVWTIEHSWPVPARSRGMHRFTGCIFSQCEPGGTALWSGRVTPARIMESRRDVLCRELTYSRTCARICIL